MINAKKTIVILLSFLCLTLIYSSCNIEPKETSIATTKVDKVLTDTIALPFNVEEEKKWDSVKYFEDVLYSSNVGVNQLNRNKLKYPYAAISYRNKKMRVTAVFSRDGV